MRRWSFSALVDRLDQSLFRSESARVLRYALPVIFVLLLLLAFILLRPYTALTSLLLILPIILSAALGGLGPGLFATFLLLAIGRVFFIEPRWSISLPEDSEDVIRMVVLAVDGILISLLSGAFRRAFIRSRTSAEALRVSEGRLRAALDQVSFVLSSITEGYFVLDSQFRFLEINPAALSMAFRHRLEELLGRGFWEVYPEAKATEFYRQYHKAMEEQTPVHFEAKSAIQDKWFEAHAYPRHGRLEIYVRDITDRKTAEQDRDRLLAGERAARAEAERANRLKDEFLAMLSHELRTPLNSISMCVQFLIESGSLPAESRHLLETISRSVKAQTQLIADLLDVSRITSGKLILEKRPVEVREFIEAAMAMVRPTAEESEVALQSSLQPDLGMVSGDPARLQQVVWNLLANAIKFSPQGGRVNIEAQRDDSHVRITVRDRGAGISADFLPHVFDRFSQADSSTRRKHGGLGLGLSIVQQVVHAHGGTVTASSPGENQGATFEVVLPVADAIPACSAAPAGGDRSSERGDLNGLRLLVVEDDLDFRALVLRVLEERHALVTLAASVSEALERYDLACPDIILADISMPEEDGFDLLRRLRAERSARRVPAVALTALAAPEDRQRILEAGFDAYLSKPVNLHDLIATLVRITRCSNPATGGSPSP